MGERNDERHLNNQSVNVPQLNQLLNTGLHRLPPFALLSTWHGCEWLYSPHGLIKVVQQEELVQVSRFHWLSDVANNESLTTCQLLLLVMRGHCSSLVIRLRLVDQYTIYCWMLVHESIGLNGLNQRWRLGCCHTVIFELCCFCSPLCECVPERPIAMEWSHWLFHGTGAFSIWMNGPVPLLSPSGQCPLVKMPQHERYSITIQQMTSLVLLSWTEGVSRCG
jgi:hypothetical protein